MLSSRLMEDQRRCLLYRAVYNLRTLRLYELIRLVLRMFAEFTQQPIRLMDSRQIARYKTSGPQTRMLGTSTISHHPNELRDVTIQPSAVWRAATTTCIRESKGTPYEMEKMEVGLEEMDLVASLQSRT